MLIQNHVGYVGIVNSGTMDNIKYEGHWWFDVQIRHNTVVDMYTTCIYMC